MKKIHIIMPMLGIFLVNSLFTAQQPQRTRVVRTRGTQQQTATATKQAAVTPARTRVVRTRGAQPVAATKQAVATPARAVRTRVPAKPTVQPVPEGVDPIIWMKLSEDQKNLFKEVNKEFLGIVAQSTSAYNLWRNAVIDQAKLILDISPSLLDYCITVITNELQKTAQIRKINATRASEYISSALRDYILQSIMTTGTEEDQFNNLLKNITDSTSRDLTQWMSNVIVKAKALVEQNKMTVQQIQASLINALKAHYDLVMLDEPRVKIVNDITNSITQRMEQVKQESSPEFVNQRYQTLLLQLSDAGNWDFSTKRPAKEWVNKIIPAAKGMANVFKFSIDELEKQIGAQIFYVAVGKKGSALTEQEKQALFSFVTGIKQQIAQ
jgi:hypothetical protein